MKDTNTVILAVIGALAIGAVGFFAGRHFNTIRVGGHYLSDDGFIGRPMMKRRTFGGNRGELTNVTGNTLTLKLANGQTTTVTLANDAAIYTLTKGTTANLKTGQTVMIQNGGFWTPTQSVIVRP